MLAAGQVFALSAQQFKACDHFAAGLCGVDHIVYIASFGCDVRIPRHGRFAVGVEQLGSVADDAAVFLVYAGLETGHIHESKQRNAGYLYL